ncbi:MAG TPA: hypothetical protein VF710_19970 [Longimicrobium sp.]|jgi:hypothetical protein
MDILFRHNTFRVLRATIAAGVLLAATAPPVQAQSQTAKEAATLESALRVREVDQARSGFGGRLVVTVDGLGALPRDGGRTADSLMLFVNGYAIRDTRGQPVGFTGNQVSFRLGYTQASRDAWTAVLAGSSLKPRRARIGVGFPGGRELRPVNEARPPTIIFRPFNKLRLWGSGIGFVLALAGFVYMVFRSGVLRDSAEESGRPMHERPFSLGRAQAAAWFFAIVAGFLYIRLVSDDYNSLNAQALMLLGLGTLTQAASGLVDNTLRDRARATLARMRPRLARMRSEVAAMEAQEEATATPANLAQLRTTLAVSRETLDDAAQQVRQAETVLKGAPSKGFVADLVSDAQGVSLHRFQMAVWTVILIGIYVTEVVTTWAMPTFNPELLALMGISGGAFVGFKLVERQTASEDAAAPAADEPAAEVVEPMSPQVFKVISDLEPATEGPPRAP